MKQALKAIPQSDQLSLSYLHGSVVSYRPGDTLKLRTLSDFEFVLMLEGTATYQCNGKNYTLPPKSMVLAQPGFRDAYQWDPAHRTRHCFLHFQIDSIPHHWPERSQWPIVMQAPAPALAELMWHVLGRNQTEAGEVTRRPSQHWNSVLESMLSIYIQTPLSEQDSATRTSQPLRLAVQWIRQALDETPEEKIELAEIAHAASISEKHLCRLFKQATGFSPMQTVRLLRLQTAVMLLSRSQLTMSEIAERCGFASQSYFTRAFGETYGVSPSTVRKQAREGKPPPPSILPADFAPRINW